jgi:hypothetical protein
VLGRRPIAARTAADEKQNATKLVSFCTEFESKRRKIGHASIAGATLSGADHSEKSSIYFQENAPDDAQRRLAYVELQLTHEQEES